MNRIFRFLLACAAMITCALATAAPSHASSFGNPSMYVIIAEIPPPYTSSWNLNTGVSSWPRLAYPYTLTEAQQVAGAIQLYLAVDHLDTLYNQEAAVASNTGLYGVSTMLADNVGPFTYSGLFSYSQLYQAFIKDSVGAYLDFHIGYTIPPIVSARAVAVDSARAEFAIDIVGSTRTKNFDQFHQDAGVLAWAGPAGPTLHAHVAHGPMTFADTFFPPTLNFTETLQFSPYTGSIDLSSLNVGDTFWVSCKAMAQVDWVYPGEVPRAFAQITDPAGNGGITIEVAGVHPLDNSLSPILAVGDLEHTARAELSAAWPNPARCGVSFSLAVARAGDYSIDVFDLSGRRVEEIAHGPFSAGTHALRWNPGSGRAGRVPAGVYFVRARGPGLDSVRRVVTLSD